MIKTRNSKKIKFTIKSFLSIRFAKELGNLSQNNNTIRLCERDGSRQLDADLPFY